MLAHSYLSATNIYIRVAGVDVKKTHTLTHPREKDKESRQDEDPDIRSIKEQPPL
jgi:hypothetical protein